MNLTKKQILVTGACGFIGSHLVEQLVKKGANVRAFVFYNNQNSWGWLEYLDKKYLSKIEVMAGDIRDPDYVMKAMKNIDIVFHLAALIGIPYSYFAPESYIQTNVMGALNVLRAAKECQLSKILMTSTSEVYGTAQYVPIDEKHPLQAQSPYAASKISADRLAESFYRTYNLPVTIVRPFNTFGPRQSARAVIPTIITQLLSGKTELKLGHLKPTRDFNFVKDIVSGFLEIAQSDKTIGEEINIATESEISIGEIAQKIINEINPKAKIIAENVRKRPKDSEVYRLLGSNKKIMHLTQWCPKYSLDEGLKETIKWFRNKNILAKYKADIFNV